MNNILGASGRPMVELGGTFAWRQFIKGDLVISLQWLDLREQGQGDGPEPVMSLFPANRRVDAGAFVVPQAKAYEYLDSKGNPTPHLMGAAFKACVAMGSEPDKALIHRIMDAIYEGMPDLIRMPTHVPVEIADRQKRQVRGIEVTAKVNGRTVQESVL